MYYLSKYTYPGWSILWTPHDHHSHSIVMEIAFISLIINKSIVNWWYKNILTSGKQTCWVISVVIFSMTLDTSLDLIWKKLSRRAFLKGAKCKAYNRTIQVTNFWVGLHKPTWGNSTWSPRVGSQFKKNWYWSCWRNNSTPKLPQYRYTENSLHQCKYHRTSWRTQQ